MSFWFDGMDLLCWDYATIFYSIFFCTVTENVLVESTQIGVLLRVPTHYVCCLHCSCLSPLKFGLLHRWPLSLLLCAAGEAGIEPLSKGSVSEGPTV